MSPAYLVFIAFSHKSIIIDYKLFHRFVQLLFLHPVSIWRYIICYSIKIIFMEVI